MEDDSVVFYVDPSNGKDSVNILIYVDYGVMYIFRGVFIKYWNVEVGEC
jgi:hypothetical protein